MQENISGCGREICHKLCNWEWTKDIWVRNAVSDKCNKREASSNMQFSWPVGGGVWKDSIKKYGMERVNAEKVRTHRVDH